MKSGRGRAFSGVDSGTHFRGCLLRSGTGTSTLCTFACFFLMKNISVTSMNTKQERTQRHSTKQSDQ